MLDEDAKSEHDTLGRQAQRSAEPIEDLQDDTVSRVSPDSANGADRPTVGRKGAWSAGVLTFAGVFFLLEVGILRQPAANFLPDDTIALMAAMGRIDDFGTLMRGKRGPVLARASDVRDLIHTPDPAGPSETIRSLRIGDMHPPAFFLLLRGWVGMFGVEYARLATLNALLVALSVGVLAVLLTQACGWWGLLVSTAVGISPGAFMSAFEIRPNALAALGLVIAMAGTMKIIGARRDPPRLSYALLCAGSVLAAYAHYMTSLAIVTVFLASLLIAWTRRERRTFWRVVCTAAISAIAMLPLVPLLRAQSLPIKKPAAKRGQASVALVSMRLAGVTGCLGFNFMTTPKGTSGYVPLVAGGTLLLGSLAMSLLGRRWALATMLGVGLILLCFVPAVLTSMRLMPRHSLQAKYYFGFAMVFAPLLAVAMLNGPGRTGRIGRALLAVVFVPIIATSFWLGATFRRPSYIGVSTKQAPSLLARADVVLIDSALRGFVLPVAANVKESAYLVMGQPGEIREWIRRGGLLMMPGRYGFYYRVGGMSSPFDLRGNEGVEALPANRLGS